MSKPDTIAVASAVIFNDESKLLVVRKKNTSFFMQVGGKLEIGESPESALKREILEEINCQVSSVQFIAEYHTQAANEAGYDLLSYTYLVKIEGQPVPQAEIAELVWLDIQHPASIALAPLTKDYILPWSQSYLLASQRHKA